MEAKKNQSADLEKKRGVFMQIGYIIALSAIFIAFEWKSYEKANYNLGALQIEQAEEEIIPITEQEFKQPPPPPPQVIELNIVENTEEIKEELNVQSSEVTEETQVNIAPVEQKEEVVEEDVVFLVVEDAPKFGNGDADLLTFLQQNIHYPQVAKELGISGIVYVTFVVDRSGKVKDAKVLRGIGGGCDEEALRVVQSMPSWSPGKQRGKPVSVQFNLPVRFVLK